MFKKQELMQKQEMVAYQKKALNDIFLRVIEWLEKYIEITYKNEFPDWERRKQIHGNNITRKDIYQYPEKAESTLVSQLHLFAAFLETDATPKFREELKQEFYKWINATEINVSDCPERLKNFLFGINEVFDKGREKIGKDIENREREIEMDSPEYMEKFSQMFADIQAPMQEQRKVAKSLEGKNPDEIKISGFNKGNNEQGEQVFEGIAKNVADSYQNFRFVKQKGRLISPQQRTNFEIIQDVKNHPLNWRIDEVFNRAKKEEVLIYHSVQLGYDGEVIGSLENQPVYPVSRFNQEELAEINRAKNISQAPIIINQQLVNSIKQNAILEKDLVVFNQEASEYYEKGDWFIHNSLEKKTDDKTGCLIYVPNAMIRAKDLNEAEQREVGYSSEQRLQHFSSSTRQENDDKISAEKVFGIMGVISALLITSTVIVKKQLNNKR